MIENDFPVLRETVAESAIGRSSMWLAKAASHAAEDAVVTRQLAAARALLDVDTAGAIRFGGITLAVAAIAAWGLSSFIPRYVGTAIPGGAFITVAAVSVLAAATSDALAGQWRSSRLRRFMTW